MPELSIVWMSVHETGGGFSPNYAVGVDNAVDFWEETVDEKVDKQKFDQVPSRLVATPPIRSKDLFGKRKIKKAKDL
jgi:hypothetical protein